MNRAAKTFSMMRPLQFIFITFLLIVPVATFAGSDVRESAEISRLEHRVAGLERVNRNVGGMAAVAILFGAFCALWAQNTGRRTWLWFFLGLFFNVVSIFFLLTKNADDKFDRREFGRTFREPRGPAGSAGVFSRRA